MEVAQVPKDSKKAKPPKIKKQSKSVEVKVPVTGTSFMVLLLSGLIALIGYSGYLGVNSIWKFTHPQFNVSLDALQSLKYIANGVAIPPIAGPAYEDGIAPTESATVTYIQKVKEFKIEFREQFPGSKLLNISDNEFLNIGWSFCKAKQEALDKDGDYSRTDIIDAHQAKFILKYPRIPGLDVYLSGVGNRAFDFLCGDN
jgi:hypothetical protein